MIALHTRGRANGRRASIMLEETGFAYEVRVADILNGEQFLADMGNINPDGKIPAIVESDGPDGKPCIAFESGAIPWSLAGKAKGPPLPDVDLDIAGRPALGRRSDAIWARPATQRGMTAPGWIMGSSLRRLSWFPLTGARRNRHRAGSSSGC